MELIWGRKISGVTLLFHMNRWAIFVWAVTGATSFLNEPTLASCIGYNVFADAVSILLLVIWAAFSALRVYAIGGGNRWLTSIVGALSMVAPVTNSYFYFGTSFYVEDPSAGCSNGSTLSPATITKFTIATRACAAAAELIVLVVTWFETHRTRMYASNANISTPISSALIRGGTLHFTLLLALDILNIVGVDTNRFTMAAGLFTIPLSAIIISHFLLDLRQIASAVDEKSLVNVSRAGALRFASFVDNIGEDLDHGCNLLSLHLPGPELDVCAEDDVWSDKEMYDIHVEDVC
ncbi:hypothetical protein CERSUDRAFT_112477 [Gelatoporia subvermispora B]|uniref:Uncharacterized protein n=1 Tax=Ceriporiopsis subvermispora (strain B) TaxID=914234 RepID=M2R2J8_CERS8|nr:hypothetical protein CERSUDRAFT_112477 [Gelatoporia subvermispora B]